ncbi:MAG: HAD hydrolase-like protein [Sedimentibacter sp.]
MNNGIIFDLDGTLWDSSRQVVDAWNHVINECEDINYSESFSHSLKRFNSTFNVV